MGVAERNGGNFVANFCQTMLNSTNSAAVLRGGGQRSDVREEEEKTAKESAGNAANRYVNIIVPIGIKV